MSMTMDCHEDVLETNVITGRMPLFILTTTVGHEADKHRANKDEKHCMHKYVEHNSSRMLTVALEICLHYSLSDIHYV